jgi:hypothetical protein
MAQQTFEIEILSVGQPTFTKTARGGYNSLEIAYKNHTFEGKVEGKKLVDFNDKDVFAFFKGLTPGARIIVTKEKGEADQYWKWVGAAYASEAQAAASGTGAASTPVSASSDTTAGAGQTSAGRGKVTGSNYETAEERAKRQVYIVRQSSLGAAIELFKVAGNTAVQARDVIEMAKVFEAYVFEKSEIPF